MNLLQNEYLHNIAEVFSIAGKDWGSLHPVVIHFPIALLMTAPLFIILGFMARRMRKGFYITALVLMLFGTVGIFVSISTGETAAESLKASPDMAHTLEEHVEYAEHARTSFLLLTLLFLLYVIFYEGLQFKFRVSLLGLFFLVYLSQAVILFNTAHYGAKLVHHHGVTSQLFSESK